MPDLGVINNVYQGALDADAGHGLSPNDLYSYIRGIGGNENEAHLLTSAAASESRLNPGAVHDSGIGYGLWGHNGDRLAAMQQAAGSQTPNWQQQAKFALDELRSRPEGKAVANATTPEQLALAEMHYEAPQGFTADNPEAGHNFTGRLNQIRLYTSLDPNATGAFAPSANPQIAPQQVAAAGIPTQSAAPSASGRLGANPFGTVGNPGLNAALYSLMTSATRSPGLSSLLGGNGSNSQTAFGASPQPPSAPAPQDRVVPHPALATGFTPVAPSSPAVPAPAVPYQAPFTMTPQQPASASVAPASSLPVFAQQPQGSGLMASLFGMFGREAA